MFLLSALTVFAVSDAFAQAFNFGRPSISPASGKSRSRIPSASIPKGVDKAIKRKAKKFKPITLESVNAALKKEKKGSRSRFKAIKANDKIALSGSRKGSRGRGKTLSATAYIKELNKLARGFAAAGYATDGSGPDVNDVGGLDTEPSVLKRQRDRLSKMFGKIRKLRVTKKFKLPKTAKKGARGKKPYRLLSSTGYQTYKPKAKRGSRGKKPAEYRWEKKQVWGPYGSKKTAAVAMDARIFILANKDVVKFEATAGADSWIFNKKEEHFPRDRKLGRRQSKSRW